ncbi:MAG: BON domain-containing protein [Burkholderiaceae bacterium]|nr:BON domain-containing protein [Burkholderiaceae bacterium]
MHKAARQTYKAAIVSAIAVIALGACSRSERQEVRTEAKQATNTAANVVDNAALTTKVKAALLADEMVKGTQINVDSNAGVVTLNGAVDSATHMQRAEQVTRGVSGVSRVQNNLTASATTAPSTMSTTPPASTTTPPSSMTTPTDTKRGTGTSKP